MPTVPLDPVDITEGHGAAPRPVEIDQPPPFAREAPTPQQPSLMGGAFRQNNVIGSTLGRQDMGISNDPEDGYASAWDGIKGTKYEDFWDRFVGVQNSRREAAIKSQIDMEERDRRTIDAAGWRGTAAVLGTSLFDPTNLLPGSVGIRSMRGGYQVAKSALDMGLATGAAVATQEALLQTTQLSRPASESAINIASGALLGSVLGGGVGVLTRGETRQASTALRVLHGAAEDRAPGAAAADLSDIATRLKAGESIAPQDIIEAGRLAALEARTGRDLTPEISARLDAVDRLVAGLERSAVASKSDELADAVRSSFGGDGARLLEGGGVKIVQSVDELPKRADGIAHPDDVRGMFDGQTAHIVADNVAPDEVHGVLLHEVGVHYGMQKMLGDEAYQRLLSDVEARVAAGEGPFAQARAAVPTDTPAAHVGEETLAYLVEHAPETGVVQSVISAVKAAIYRMTGGKFGRLSENDIRALAISALRRWNPEAGPASEAITRYSRGSSTALRDGNEDLSPYGLPRGGKYGTLGARQSADVSYEEAAKRVVQGLGDGPDGRVASNAGEAAQREADGLSGRAVEGGGVPGESAAAAGDGTAGPNYSRGQPRSERIARQLDLLAQAVQNIDSHSTFQSVMSHAAAAGAEATDTAGVEDLTISGRMANAAARATAFLNPNLRSNFRAAGSARSVAQQLAENTVYQTMHDEGRSLGAAVETIARQNVNSRMFEGMKAHNAAYSEMRKAGVQMSHGDFEQAVGQALRRADEGANPYVTKAAQAWRKSVFDPFKDEAIAAGLLPADVTPEGAASYFTRIYNRERLNTGEADFKQRVANYYSGAVKSEFEKHAQLTGSRIAALENEISDLRVPAEQRTQMLSDLETKLADLEAKNPDHIERSLRVNELRRNATAAEDAGNRAAAKTARDEASQLVSEGGDAFKAFLKDRGQLRMRQRRVELNYAGMMERSDRIQQQMVDLQDRNQRNMARLLDRGRAFEKEAQRLDPAKRDAKITALKNQFADVARRSEQAADRMANEAKRISLNLMAGMEKAAKERDAGGMTGALAGTTEAKATAASREAEMQLAEKISQNAKAERVRFEKLNSIARRLEEAEALDPEARMMELRRAMDDIATQASDRSLEKGERAARLQDRLKKLDPKVIDERIATVEKMKSDLKAEFRERWRQRGVEVNYDEPATKLDFNDFARDIADQVFDTITGRTTDAEAAAAEFVTPLRSGPLKERTFNVPDTLIEPYLESHVSEVAQRYARSMAAQVEMTHRFGKASMADQIRDIQLEYRGLRESVQNAGSAKEAMALLEQRPGVLDGLKAWGRGIDREEIGKEKLLQFLAHDEKGALEDIQAMRDMILGRYKVAENSGNFARIQRGLMTFNYIRAMGGALIANIADLYRPAMVHGLGRFMSEGIAPLMTNLDAVKLSVHEAQLAGQVTESVLHHRMMTLGEIADPYRGATAMEKLLENGAKLATKWNGMAVWTDATQAISSTLSQNRILRGVLGKEKDDRFLAYLGIDAGMAGRIAEKFNAHGEVRDGIHIANTEAWTDGLTGPALDAAKAEVRAYRAAIGKDVDSIIVRRSVGDVPLFAATPVGKMMLQFRSFNLAANQRVMLRAMQEDQARFVGSIVAMSSIGAMAAAMRSWRGGEERWQKFKESARNPGYLIGEGLDLSGVFTVPFEMANTAEKLLQPTGTNFNPIKTPMLRAFPGQSQQGESTRFVSRDPVGALLGPSASLPMTVGKAIGGDKKAQQQLVPFGAHLGMREAVQAVFGDSPY